MRIFLVLAFFTFCSCTIVHAQKKVKLIDRIKDAASKVEQQINQPTSRPPSTSQTPDPSTTSIRVERRDYFENPNDFVVKALSYEKVNYNSNSSTLESISIAAHNGRPRFGSQLNMVEKIKSLNFDGMVDDRRQRSDALKLAYLNAEKLAREYQKFSVATRAKYLIDKCPDLKSSDLITGPSARGTKDSMPLGSCQDGMRVAAGVLATNDAYKEYFCSNRSSCADGNRLHQKNAPLYWSGSRESEFKSRDAFKAFMEKTYSSLVSYSNNLPEGGYLISRESLSRYDFDRGGFDLTLSFKDMNNFAKLVGGLMR